MMLASIPEDKFAYWMKYLSVDNAVRTALIQAYYDGRNSMWEELIAQTEVVLKMKEEKENELKQSTKP